VSSIFGETSKASDPGLGVRFELGWGADCGMEDAQCVHVTLRKAGEGPGLARAACTEGQATERFVALRVAWHRGVRQAHGMERQQWETTGSVAQSSQVYCGILFKPVGTPQLHAVKQRREMRPRMRKTPKTIKSRKVSTFSFKFTILTHFAW